MSAHIIGNPVPSPEEMGEILGLSADRVKAVRAIMSTPAKQKTTNVIGNIFSTAARKKSLRGRKRTRAAGKK